METGVEKNRSIGRGKMIRRGQAGEGGERKRDVWTRREQYNGRSQPSSYLTPFLTSLGA